MSPPPASQGPEAPAHPTPGEATSEGQAAASIRVDATPPKHAEPRTIPFAKVHARPELAGQTGDGEPMLRLAEGDRRAATMREVDRRAIDAALARARHPLPPAPEEAASSEVRPSVAEIAPARPAPRSSAMVWVACLAVPGLVIAAVLVLTQSGARDDRPRSTADAWSSHEHGSPVSPQTTSPFAPEPPSPIEAAPSAHEQTEDRTPRDDERRATNGSSEPGVPSPQATCAPNDEPTPPKPRILLHVKSK
jgi:hypothetical protein